MIHVLSIAHRRRRVSDTFVLPPYALRSVRRVYGQLREQGFDAWSARGIVLDLVLVGQNATYTPATPKAVAS